MPPEPPPDSADNCLSCEGGIIIAVSSDESDEEVEMDHGYTLLGQQETANDESSGEDDNSDMEEQPVSSCNNPQSEQESEEVSIHAPTSTSDGHECLNRKVRSITEKCLVQQNINLPPPPRPGGSEDIAAIWNTQRTSSLALDLNAERAAQIQAAMVGFTLPPSAVPAWAENIPEEQWKQGLLERLQRGSHNCKPGASCCSKNN